MILFNTYYSFDLLLKIFIRNRKPILILMKKYSNFRKCNPFIKILEQKVEISQKYFGGHDLDLIFLSKSSNILNKCLQLEILLVIRLITNLKDGTVSTVYMLSCVLSSLDYKVNSRPSTFYVTNVAWQDQIEQGSTRE